MQLFPIKLKCASCGKESVIGAKFCNTCGNSIIAPTQYASFWKRTLAYTLDLPIVLTLSVAIGYPAGYVMALLIGRGTAVDVFLCTFVLVLFFYFPLFESSVYKATPGKLLCGLEVTNMAGNKLTFWKACARRFFRDVAPVPLTCGVGFLMVALNQKRQGLHDFLTQTLVLQKAFYRTPVQLLSEAMENVRNVATKSSRRDWESLSDKAVCGVVFTGAILIVGMGLCPPWVETFSFSSRAGATSSRTPLGYYPIFAPPEKKHDMAAYGIAIDTERLLIQWFIVAVAVSGVFGASKFFTSAEHKKSASVFDTKP